MSNLPQVTREDVQKAIAAELSKLKASHSKEKQVELGASWYACAACEAGLNATLAALILVAIAGFPEDTPAIAAIAAATGLSTSVVTVILAGGAAGLETIISELCKAMGACS